MSDALRQRELEARVQRARRERAAAERYAQRQWEAKRGWTWSTHGPYPVQFDESGFPIPPRGPRFVQRVARLIAPGARPTQIGD